MGRRCNCRCNMPPECFGCGSGITVPDLSTITASWTAPSWPFGTHDSNCSESWVELPAFGSNTYGYTAEYNTHTLDIANVGTSPTLYQRPDGQCHWLWNDVRSVKQVWHSWAAGDYATWKATLEEVSTYEPVNADDPNNPWNRVMTPVTDARCGTAVVDGQGRWCCTQSVYGTWLELEILPGPTSGADFRYTPDGPLWWVCELRAIIQRSWITTIDPTTQASYLFDFVNPGRVRLLDFRCNNSNRQGRCDSTNIGFGSGSCPPYRTYSSFAGCGVGRFPEDGGPVAFFAKVVDCDTDFEGDPITLVKDTGSLGGQQEDAVTRAAMYSVTTDSSIDITL